MLYFFLGAIFLTIILPVLDQIGATIGMVFELAKAKLSLEITKINDSIRAYDTDQVQSRAIGFHLEEEEDYDDEVL